MKMFDLCELTNLFINELLFHLTDKIDFVQHLKLGWRSDLASDILSSFSELLGSYSVAIFKITKYVNEQVQAS